MRIVVFDSTAVSGEGPKPGNAAQFSTPTIKRLRDRGHTVEVTNQFDDDLAASADVVWTEWCHNEAFAAAASKACRRLVLRMRGFDVWNPLETLKWENVHALVYESVVLKKVAEERFPFLKDRETHVIPAGVDTWRFPFGLRRPGKPVVAMLGRAVSDKGFQLAYEWMRRRSDLHLHIALALTDLNPRLLRYLQETKPENVTLHYDVDTPLFLTIIDPGYVLSTSIWETFGYSIAEAMAMGFKPLIHEYPHVREVWHEQFVWKSLDDLDRIQRNDADYDSWSYRSYILDNFDADKCTDRFEEVLASTTEPTAYVSASVSMQSSAERDTQELARELEDAFNAEDLERAEKLVNEFRARVGGDTHREEVSYMLLNLAALHFNKERYDEAEVWALRSLRRFPRADTFALLGEIFVATGDIAGAREWFKAARSATPLAQMLPGVLEGVHEGLVRIDDQYKLYPIVQGSRVPHVLVIQTCSVQRLDQTIRNLERAGLERWRGPKLIVADGFDPGKRPGFAVASTREQQGQARTFFRALDLATSMYNDYQRVTFFEDDVVPCTNALDYIQDVGLDRLDLISWYTMARCPFRAQTPNSVVEIPIEQFSRIPAITLRSGFAKLITTSSFAREWTERHGADMIFSKFEGARIGVHFPAIVDHGDAPSMTGNQGPRKAPTFPGVRFDAARFLDGKR